MGVFAEKLKAPKAFLVSVADLFPVISPCKQKEILIQLAFMRCRTN